MIELERLFVNYEVEKSHNVLSNIENAPNEQVQARLGHNDIISKNQF